MEKDGEGTDGGERNGRKWANCTLEEKRRRASAWETGGGSIREQKERKLRQLVCCVLLCQRFTQAPAIYSWSVWINRGLYSPLISLSLPVCVSLSPVSLTKTVIFSWDNQSPSFLKGPLCSTMLSLCETVQNTSIFSFKKKNLCVCFVSKCLCWREECVQKQSAFNVNKDERYTVLKENSDQLYHALLFTPTFAP